MCKLNNYSIKFIISGQEHVYTVYKVWWWAIYTLWPTFDSWSWIHLIPSFSVPVVECHAFDTRHTGCEKPVSEAFRRTTGLSERYSTQRSKLRDSTNISHCLFIWHTGGLCERRIERVWKRQWKSTFKHYKNVAELSLYLT